MDNLSYLEQKPLSRSRISILPIPLDLGSDNVGMAEGPKYLLSLGVKKAFETAGLSVDVLPEIPASRKQLFKGRKVQKKDFLPYIAKITAESKNVVQEHIGKGNFVLAVGGDHAIVPGTIAGATEAVGGDIGVIWIDAHTDIHTHESSFSGNVHGMGSAAMLGFGDPRLTESVTTKVKPENLLYIGLKDLDQAEIDFMRKKNIAAVTILDLLEHGLSIATKKIDELQKRVGNIWISLDVDGIDEECAPASALASSGGLTRREVTNLVTRIGKSGKVIGMDLVELFPKKDVEQKTGKLCMELVVSAFDGRYTWYSEYMSHYEHSA